MRCINSLNVTYKTQLQRVSINHLLWWINQCNHNNAWQINAICFIAKLFYFRNWSRMNIYLSYSLKLNNTIDFQLCVFMQISQPQVHIWCRSMNSVVIKSANYSVSPSFCIQTYCSTQSISMQGLVFIGSLQCWWSFNLQFIIYFLQART